MTMLGGLLMMIATSLFSQEYIDLSLPSGTLWATYDIGCTFEGDMSGTEFYWADIEYSTNLWDMQAEAYTIGQNMQGDPRYDIATAMWGNDWCTPTLEQWHELLYHCFFRVLTYNSRVRRDVLRCYRCYEDLEAGTFDYDNNVYITFTHNTSASSYWVSSYWTATQNMDSYPKDEKRDTTRAWTNDSYDFDLTYNGIRLTPEHGYPYNIYFRDDEGAPHLSLAVPYHKKLVRPVRNTNKEVIPTAIREVAPDNTSRLLYRFGPIDIFSDGRKVIRKR